MKKIKKYFSYNSINEEITSYGYVYTVSRYAASIIVMVFAIVLGALIFQLKLQFSMSVTIAGLLCLPQITRVQYRALYQQRRFKDVDGYMHQMAYSFQKQPKISMALSDAYKISDGNMKNKIMEARDELQYGTSQWVFTDALSIIESAYTCERITLLHRFMITVEEKGGSYNNSMDVLISDIDRWVKRIYQSQEDIKKVKRDLGIGIIISIMLAATTVVISAILGSTSLIYINICDDNMYQIVSTLFLMACELFFTYTQVHYNNDWLVAARTDKEIERDLRIAFNQNSKVNFRRKVIIIAAGIAAAIICAYIWNSIIAVCIAVCAFIVADAPDIAKQSSKKRIIEDLYNGFSEWLRNVALDLQEKTLQTAIQDSYNNCPVVMKQSLSRFIDELNIEPSDVTPYYRFLSEFKIHDISTIVRTLYGLSELDHANIDETINGLIARNYDTVDKHDMVCQEDKISIMKFSEYIPVLFASLKIGVDMMLVITCYL